MIKLVVRFQWVKCQLDALGRCLNLSSLRKALRSLPKDLDDTYARILQSIEDDEHSKLVATIVQWLAYSTRPMSLVEISEALTVDPDDDHPFDVERRLEDPQDLLRICSSLVTMVPRERQFWDPPGSSEILQFAHFSVREYLESSRILDGPAKRYAIQELRSNTFLAESCIIFLLHFDVPQTCTYRDYRDSLYEEYPLVRYAVSNWFVHAERAEEGGNIITLSKVFLRKAYRLPRWVMTDLNTSYQFFDAKGKHLPLLNASMYNLPKITSALISEGADVNARNDRNDTALIIAAGKGRLETVRILLDSGAEMDLHSQKGKTALTEAAEYGRSQVVRLLLDRGVSTRNPSGEQALVCASSCYGNPETVGILLERGVDVDAKSYDTRVPKRMYGQRLLASALCRSLTYKKKSVTKLLLEYGADVNFQWTIKGTRGVLFEYLLNHGRECIAEALLQYGADPRLVAPEHLNEDGMRVWKERRYVERFLLIQSQDGSARVQEGEMEEAVADV